MTCIPHKKIKKKKRIRKLKKIKKLFYNDFLFK
jgi:hypothetical protein